MENEKYITRYMRNRYHTDDEYRNKLLAKQREKYRIMVSTEEGKQKLKQKMAGYMKTYKAKEAKREYRKTHTVGANCNLPQHKRDDEWLFNIADDVFK